MRRELAMMAGPTLFALMPSRRLACGSWYVHRIRTDRRSPFPPGVTHSQSGDVSAPNRGVRMPVSWQILRRRRSR